MYDKELGGDLVVRGCTRCWLRLVTNWGVRSLGYITAGRRWGLQFDHALQPSCCGHLPKPLRWNDKQYFGLNVSAGVNKAWLHRKTGTVSHYFVFRNTRSFWILTYRCCTCFVVFLFKNIRKQHPYVKKVNNSMVVKQNWEWNCTEHASREVMLFQSVVSERVFLVP